MQNFILYQSYGSIDHINECRYSLLKYLAVYNLQPPAHIGIIIYTDQPAHFEAFVPFFKDFQLKEISHEQIKLWRGEIDFVHRVKIEIIKEFLDFNEGAVLYLDTDTYINGPVESIFQELEKGVFYMHDYEGMLDKSINASFRKWERFLSHATVKYGGNQVVFNKELKMWNAGVIGMNSLQRDLLGNVLSLTDAVYKQFPKHIAEQFAFSYCFQHSGEVRAANNKIEHYWNLKEFRKLLQVFFIRNQEESIPNQVKLINHIDASSIRDQKIAFERLPFYKKWAKIVKGKGWSIDNYKKKFSTY